MSYEHNSLVSIQLKTLIDLARPATFLKLRHSSIRAMQSGGYVSRFKGRGMEFDEARLYQPGDDIRSIDWRVTARSGKTHTKVFREERERPVFISVDNRAAMQFATRGMFKSVQAARLAALLAWSAQHKGDRIGGQVYTDSGCQELKPQNGKHTVLRFFNVLSSPEQTATKIQSMTLEHSLVRLQRHARPGSLVYIISEFRGLDDKAEQHLAKLSRHCDLVLIQVYDPLESHLPEKGRYRFTDDQRDLIIDSGDKQRILHYQQQHQQRLDALQRIVKKLGLVFFQCSTRDDPVEVLR